MPPRIYKSGRRSINFPTGRQYNFAGIAFLGIDFPTYAQTYQTGQNSFLIDFQTFNQTLEAAPSDINFLIPFSSFTPSFNVISGAFLEFDINFKSFAQLFQSQSFDFSSYAIDASIAGVGLQKQNLSLNVNAIEITADGTIIGSITVATNTDEQSSELPDALTFTGDTYLVLNLKNKAHTIYMDGNNNAIAETGHIAFGNNHQKNISDLYVNGRSDGEPEVITVIDESKERTYDLSFRSDDSANLSNRKLRLAKGIKGHGWQFKFVSKDGDHLEVRKVDLEVHKLKRRI